MRHFAALLAFLCVSLSLGAASSSARAACPAGDHLDTQLRDKELQRQLILSGFLAAEIGRANERLLRAAVLDFRAAHTLPGTDKELLTEAECATLKATHDAVYAYIGFQDVTNEVNKLKLTFPAKLLPPTPTPSTESWQEYESPLTHAGIDLFRVSGRESSTNSFSRGYLTYSSLTLTYLHNSGSELIAEGAGNRWGSRYYFHNLTYEYQGGQRGVYIRFEMKPPEGFTPPAEILAAARLDKIKKQIGKLYAGAPDGGATPGEAEIAWSLIARAVFNIMASDFYDQNGWRELTTDNCTFGPEKRARRGGVRIVFATTRAIANKDGNLDTMFDTTANDKVTFGCVQLLPNLAVTNGTNLSWAWRGGATATAAPIKLLGESLDRNAEGYVRLIDTSAAEDSTHALLVVHGYNNTFADAMQAAARIAGGADYKGRVYVFSWPSVSQSLRYLQDVDNAEEAEGSLQAFLAAILRDNNIRTLDIVAHSMGSQQLMRVLGSIRSVLDDRRHEEGSLRLGQVVFAAPDVSAAVFNIKIGQWAKLAQRVTIYTSGGDWVLWLSSFMRGFNDRAGGHAPWREPLRVDASNAYVIDTTPPAADFWKFYRYSHADFVYDKTLLNDIQAVLTGKPAGDPGKRDPKGEVFKVVPYKGVPDRKYWATLP